MTSFLTEDAADLPSSSVTRYLRLALRLWPADLGLLCQTLPGAPMRQIIAGPHASATELLPPQAWRDLLADQPPFVAIANTAADERLAAFPVHSIRSLVRLHLDGGPAGAVTLWLCHSAPRTLDPDTSADLRDLGKLLAAALAYPSSDTATELYLPYFYAVLQNATDLVAINDIHGVVQYISPSVTHILGYQPADLVGKSSFSLVHPDDVAMIVTSFQHATAVPGVNPKTRLRFRSADGSWRLLEAASTNLLADPQIRGVIVNARDITDQHTAEQLLRESEERYRRLVELAPDMVLLIKDGFITFINRTGLEMIAATDPAQVLGKPATSLLHPDDRLIAHARLAKLAAGSELSPKVYQIRCLDGQLREVEAVSSQITHDGARVTLTVGRDVTDRHRQEEQIRFQASVLDQMSDAVVAIDSSYRIIYMNPAAERLYGQTLTSARGWGLERIYKVIYESAAAEEAAWSEMHSTGLWRGDCYHRLSDGRMLAVELAVVALATVGGTCMVAVIRDMSDRKSLEAQLLQAQKLESIGRLAGGVAHDFNNLLTAIGGYADMAFEASTELTVRADLTEIRRSVERATALTRQLLTFSRRQSYSPRIMPINQIVQQAESLLKRLLGPTIVLHTELGAGGALVAIDPMQIEQVLINMAVNARDAMPGGGTLLLRTMLLPVLARSDTVSYVRIVVQDDGMGMSAEVRKHLFEPFFTTKPVGQGTGLGLATCYGIIKQHGGRISVISDEGHGSTFTIDLPLCAASAPDHAAPRAAPRHHTGSGLVLVVDDDASVRALVLRILQNAGYTTLEASNGTEALQILGNPTRPPLRLVLSDLLMPLMDGRMLGEWISAQGLDMPVLYMSGHAFTGAGTTAPPPTPLLHKPFNADDLLLAIQNLLEHR